MRGLPAPRRSVMVFRRAIACCLSLIVLLAPAGMTAEPKPTPQRSIPARDLIVYVEFDGLAAHADAWQATAAYAILAKTPAGVMMSEIARQILDRLLRMVPGGKLTGADVIALHDHLVHHGFAIALHRHRDEGSSWTVVLNGLGRQGTRERFDRLLGALLAPTPPAKGPTPVRLRGRDVYQLVHRAEAPPASVPEPGGLAPRNEPAAPAIPWLSWWFENDDLVLTSTPFSTFELVFEPAKGKPLAEAHASHLGAVLDVLEGKQPDVTTHPAYAAAMSEGRDIKGFEPDGLFFIDPGKKGGLFRGLLEAPGALKLPQLVTGSVPKLTDDRIPGPVPVDPFPNPFRPPAATGGPDDPVSPGGPGTPALPPAAVPAGIPGATVPGVEAIPGVSAPPAAPVAPVFPGERGAAAPVPSPTPPAGREPRSRPQGDDRGDGAKKAADPSEILGLDGVQRIVGRWGFQGKALLTDVRIEAPGPRKGLVGWLDQPAFDKDDLPPIPRSTSRFVVDSFDPAAAYGRFTELAKKVEPEMGALIEQFERTTRDATGLRLREDLLNHLGPTWFILPVAPADGRDGDKGDLLAGAYVLVVGLKDADGFLKVLDTLALRANQYLRDREKLNDAGAPVGGRPDPPMLALERLPAPDRGYRLFSPSRLVFWLNDEIQPTILVGRSYIALAANPGRAREALAFEREGASRWRPTGELARSFECLPPKLTLLAVGDSGDSSVPSLIAGLPGMVQLLSTGLSDLDDPNAAMSMDLLTLAGVPGEGGFRLRIDPDRIPKAEDLQSHLFPSVLAATVDGRGIRFLLREAFPLACAGDRTHLKSSLKWSGAKGLKRDLKLGWKWGSGG